MTKFNRSSLELAVGELTPLTMAQGNVLLQSVTKSNDPNPKNNTALTFY